VDKDGINVFTLSPGHAIMIKPDTSVGEECPVTPAMQKQMRYLGIMRWIEGRTWVSFGVDGVECLAQPWVQAGDVKKGPAVRVKVAQAPPQKVASQPRKRAATLDDSWLD
jgi:hypothetical protein